MKQLTALLLCALLALAPALAPALAEGGAAFGLMAWIGVYDTFFLDWVLFANMQYFRLPGTEHMDEAYPSTYATIFGFILSLILPVFLC